MRVKMSAQNNFGNSSKADLKFFIPLAVMQTQNSKERQFSGEENQKSGLHDFAYCRRLDVCKISGRDVQK